MGLLALLLLSVVFIVFSTTKFKMHPFLALLFAAIGFGLFSGMSLERIVESINGGFGDTLGKIGLVIILGVLIGAFLEHSGGAFAIAERVLKIIGKKRVPLSMSIIGYIVSIPVFADSGFIILLPLAKALSKRVKLSLAVSAIALSLGLLASHTMVPPTPGPIAAAGILKADLGLVIFWGLVVSVLGMIPGFIFAKKVASKFYIDPNPDFSEEEIRSKIKTAPSASLALLPILIPILLIVLKSFSTYAHWFETGFTNKIITFVGSPVIALLIGLFLAFLLPKKLEKKMFSTNGWVGKALTDAAIILMITGAGGVFGKVLQNSNLATVIGEHLGQAHLGMWLPFLIAAALKTAQGSSTVALITAASIMAPLMSQLGFESEMAKALVVLSIGAGSAVVSHANDSFFWIITQMTGMDVATGYRLQSVGSGIMGTSAALVVFVIWWFIM